MHHYCAIWSKTESAADGLTARLEQFVHRRLSFEPDELVLHRIGSRVVVFSASANQPTIGIESPCHLSERGACLVGGLPTFERFPSYPPSGRMRPAAWLDELLQAVDPQSLYLDLGGNWSVVRADAAKLTGFSAFSGYDSLYYLDNDLYAAVGNRASLVAALQSQGPCSATDLEALSWLPAALHIVGHHSPFAEVRRVPTGHSIELERGAVSLRPFTTDSFTPPDHSELPAARAAAIDGLVARYRWYLSTGIRLEAHLTGGKDSRAGLALLLAAGGADRLERLLTIGSEDNGDVIVARQIAASLGIANHEVRAGPKAALDETDWDSHCDWFSYSPWRYDLALTPWDGREWVSDTASPVAALTGAGGEIYRGGVAFDDDADPLEAYPEWFMGWYDRRNRLDVLGHERVAAQREYLRDEARRMVEAGVVHVHQRFYIEHVIGTWGNGQLRAESNHSIAGLTDLNLARLMHSRSDMDDELPYEVIRRCAPELQAFPFAGDRWAGRTLARAKADGVDRAPVEAPSASGFPWQYVLYRDWRNVLIREVLRHVSLWEDVVDVDRLEALLGSPVEPFKSPHVKNLFALVAATNHLRGELRTDRAFAATSRPLRLSGSLGGTTRQWFAHRFAPLGEGLSGTRATGRWGVTPNPDGSTAAAAAREQAATRRYFEQRQRDLVKAEREIEKRDRLVHAAQEELRIGRGEARAIQRSGSWRLLQTISRLGRLFGRGGTGPPERLERLARLSAAGPPVASATEAETAPSRDGVLPDLATPVRSTGAESASQAPEAVQRPTE